MANKVSILLEARDINASSTLAKVNGALGSMEKSLKGGVRGVLDDIAGAAPGLGALGVAATGVGVAVAAWKLGSGAVELAKLGAESQRTETAFRSLAAQSGESANAMLSSMQQASRGAISNSALMLSANRAMVLGVADNADEMSQLIGVAIAKGQQLGVGAEQAFGDLVAGIGRMSPLILDNLGIVTGGEKTFNDYAASIGKTAAQLSDAERKQALLNKVLADMPSGGVVDDATSAFGRMDASITNAKEALGRLFAPAVAAGANALASGINAVADGIDRLNQPPPHNPAGDPELVNSMQEQKQLLQEMIQLRDRFDWSQPAMLAPKFQDMGIATQDDVLVHIAEISKEIASAQDQLAGIIMNRTSPAMKTLGMDVQGAAEAQRVSIQQATNAILQQAQAIESAKAAASQNSPTGMIDPSFVTNLTALGDALRAGIVDGATYTQTVGTLAGALGQNNAQSILAAQAIAELTRHYNDGKITLEVYQNAVEASIRSIGELTDAKAGLRVALDLTGGRLRAIVADFAAANQAAAATTETVRHSIAALGALSNMQSRMMKEARTGLALAPQHDFGKSFDAIGPLSDVGKLQSAIDGLKGSVASTASQIVGTKGADAALAYYNQQVAAIEKQGKAWLDTNQDIDAITNILLPGFNQQLSAGAKEMYGLGKRTAGVRGGVNDITSALNSMAQAQVPTLGATGALNWLNQATTEVNAQVAAWKQAGYSQKQITDVLLPSYLSQLRKANGELGNMDERMKSIKSKTSSVLSGALSDIGGVDLGKILPHQDSVSEDARRLADVAVKGFESPWAEYLQNKYPQLIGEVFKNTGDVKGAAANILKDFQDGLRPELLDKDRAKELVKRAILGDQNMKALSDEIAKELSAEMSGVSLADAKASAEKALGGSAGDGKGKMELSVLPRLDMGEFPGRSEVLKLFGDSGVPTVNNPLSVPVSLDTSTLPTPSAPLDIPIAVDESMLPTVSNPISLPVALDTSALPTASNPLSVPVALDTSALPTASSPVSVPVVLDTTSVDPTLIQSLIGAVSVKATINEMTVAEGIEKPTVTGLVGVIDRVERRTTDAAPQLGEIGLANVISVDINGVINSIGLSPTAIKPEITGLTGVIGNVQVRLASADAPALGEIGLAKATTIDVDVAGVITSISQSAALVIPTLRLDATIATLAMGEDARAITEVPRSLTGILSSVTLSEKAQGVLSFLYQLVGEINPVLKPGAVLPSVHLVGDVDSLGIPATAVKPEVTGLTGVISSVAVRLASSDAPALGQIGFAETAKVNVEGVINTVSTNAALVVPALRLGGMIDFVGISTQIINPPVDGLTGVIRNLEVDLASDETPQLGDIGKTAQPLSVPVMAQATSFSYAPGMVIPTLSVGAKIDSIGLPPTTIIPTIDISSLAGLSGKISQINVDENTVNPTITGLVGVLARVTWQAGDTTVVDVSGRIVAVALSPSTVLPSVNDLSGIVSSLSLLDGITVPADATVTGVVMGDGVIAPPVKTQGVVSNVQIATGITPPSITASGIVSSVTTDPTLTVPSVSGMAGTIDNVFLSPTASLPAVTGLSGTISNVSIDEQAKPPSISAGGIVASTVIDPTLSIPSVQMGGIVGSVEVSPQATPPAITGLTGTISSVTLAENATLPPVVMPKPVKVDLLANGPQETPRIDQLTGMIGTVTVSPDAVLPAVTGLTGTINTVTVELASAVPSLTDIGQGAQLPTVGVQGSITSVTQSPDVLLPAVRMGAMIDSIGMAPTAILPNVTIQPVLDVQTGIDGYIAAGFWITASIHQGIIDYGLPSAIETELLKAGPGALDAGQQSGAQYARGFIDSFGGSVPGSVLAILATLIAPLVSAKQQQQKTRTGAN